MDREAFRNRIIGYGEEPPEQLLANPHNWRVHPAAQQRALEGVLEEVGWVANVIVNRRTGHVVDGHLRIALAISRGEPVVPVTYVDLSEEEEKLIVASFDPIGALAVADSEKLGELLAEVEAESEGLQALLDDMAAEAGIDLGEEPPDDPGPQLDRAEELQEKWRVQRGDIWEIPSKAVPGRAHRVMCGDSTERIRVAGLVNGEEISAIITDPPYGIGRAGMPNDQVEGLYDLYCQCLAAISVNDAILIAFQSPRLFWVWLDSLRAMQWTFERALWWYEPYTPASRTRAYPWHGWYMQGELIMIATRGKPPWPDKVQFTSDTYRHEFGDERVTEQGSIKETWHPTVKPLWIVQDLIVHTSGDVYDPFLGSGTTIVACEQTGRIGYGMEIEPKYVAVTLQRLADMGLEPARV